MLAVAPTRRCAVEPWGGANDRGSLSVAVEAVREAEVLHLPPGRTEAAVLTGLPAMHTPCQSLLYSICDSAVVVKSSSQAWCSIGRFSTASAIMHA